MTPETLAPQQPEMSSTEPQPHGVPAYLRPGSVIAMLSYSALLVAAFVYFLRYVPPLFPERTEAPTAAIDVPSQLTEEGTVGYR